MYIFGELTNWASDIQIELAWIHFHLSNSTPYPVKCSRFLKPSECEKAPACLCLDYVLSKTIAYLETYSFIFLKMKIPLSKQGE